MGKILDRRFGPVIPNEFNSDPAGGGGGSLTMKIM